jgi:hypothetical protein
MATSENQPPKRNIDERIDAITMNLELLAGMQRDSDARLSVRIDKLTAAIEADAENIRALARIAETHERHISSVEGQSEQ